LSKSPSILKLCVVTGSRAEYGLLSPLLALIKKDRSATLQLLVTGMHLSPEFGSTYRQIEKDGFTIDEKVEMLLSSDTDTGTVKSTGLAMIGFADAFQRLQPHWVIVLGDRFEIFAAATAAHLLKIPVAHLHGGELTEGATDDAMRHAITKMSYLHFTATEEYRKRVIRLGESPDRVWNVGAIGLENIRTLKLLDRKKLSAQLGFPIDKPTVLVTFHPVTLEKDTAEGQMENLLVALDQFPGLQVLFTLPNADAKGRAIMRIIEEYVVKNPARSRAFASLGQLKYLSALQYVKVVVGNSSSGIIEAPQFNIPTVNIGDRQTGRIKPASVIDVGTDVQSIVTGIRKAVSPAFLKSCSKVKNPYAGGNTAATILQTIRQAGQLSSVKKPFYESKS
jgi:GDP/UDP-N,N'-diacetylbacillosamine 2-epimerase (hydrolysing)